MALLEVLVETVALRDELLLPGPESLLLDLDLLGEALPEGLLLLFEFGVVELARAGFAELARLHLLATVGLVVVFFGRVDQIKHVCADKDGAQLLEVAVLLVLDLGNTPCVLAALDGAAVGGGDVLFAADDGEGHGVDERVGVLQGGVVVFIERGLVDFDALGVDDAADLGLILAFDLRCSSRVMAWAYSGLEGKEIGRAQRVGLCDDGDEVDAGAQALHDLNVQRLERVAGGSDKVETGVDTEIDLVAAAGLLLLEHVRLVLVVEELDDGLPRVAVVDVVAKAGRVDDG